MRRTFGITAALVAMSWLAATSCIPRSVSDAPEAEPETASVAERQRELLHALADRDAERVAAFFSDDAMLQVANMPPVEGRGEILRFFGNTFGFLEASDVAPVTLSVSNDGGMAHGTGKTSNQFRGPDGPVTYEGKYAMVWERRAGDWMVVLYAISSNHPEARTEETAMRHASGTFDVTMTPVGTASDASGAPASSGSGDASGARSGDPPGTRSDNGPGGVTLGRSLLEKRFHGGLEGTSTGEMLTALTPVEGSAVYVAIERVSGTLDGRSGTFALHHRGVMTRGQQDLVVTVVPDSGTGGLEGLEGTMTITAEDGEHRYAFEYAIPERP